jgi:hypothetical protein
LGKSAGRFGHRLKWVLLQIGDLGGVGLLPDEKLHGDAEDRVDELTLTEKIGLTDPPDLPFSNCMHRLVALDCSPRAFR